MITYNLVRSKRKTMAIYIKPDVTVEVRAPLRVAKTDIDKFVASKEKWIKDKLRLVEEKSEKRAVFCLDYGSTVLFRGKEYPIVEKLGNLAGFNDECFYLPPDLAGEQIKNTCIQIYKMLGKQVLTAKTGKFSQLMGVDSLAVKINSAKTRWGSCSSRKNINYSWRLVMAPDEVIDYVVVHELAHLREMNHSDRFWQIVAAILPDYQERQKKLKSLQKLLSEQDWS